MAGLAHLANHTCCLHHRNSELQILSVWQEDRTSATLQGPAGEGSGARNSMALGRTLVASLRATKLIQKGTLVLTCYRNTSSAGTTAQLIKKRQTLGRMFQCSCCLCEGSCGGSSSEAGLGHPAPSFPLTEGLETPACTRPEEAASAPTAGLSMQLKWCSSADKRKTSRLNPMGNKPAWRSRPSEAV